MVSGHSNLIGSLNLCSCDFVGSRTSHKHIRVLVDYLFVEQTALFIWVTLIIYLINFNEV